MSVYMSNETAHLSGVNPKVQLEGTETNAKNLSIRENAGVTEIYDESTGTVIMTIEEHAERHELDGADEIHGIAIFNTADNRPAAGTADRFFLATDTWELSYDNGTDWVTIGTLGGLSLPSHSNRHKEGGGDYPGYYLHINKSGSSEAAGVSGVYGTSSTISPETGYYSILPHLITATVGGTIASGETITVQATISYDDGTNNNLATKSATATGDLTWDLTEITGSYVDGGKITKISVAASSSASSTSATVTGNVKGIEFI